MKVPLAIPSNRAIICRQKSGIAVSYSALKPKQTIVLGKVNVIKSFLLLLHSTFSSELKNCWQVDKKYLRGKHKLFRLGWQTFWATSLRRLNGSRKVWVYWNYLHLVFKSNNILWMRDPLPVILDEPSGKASKVISGKLGQW